MADYTKNTSWVAERGVDSDPALLDAEFDELQTVSATKVDLDNASVQTMLGHLAVPAGATGSQVMRKSEIDTALALKANLASPTFTGTVVVPVASDTASPTQKTYVDTLLATKAPLASPALTGSPTINGLAAATTADVASAVAAQHSRAWSAPARSSGAVYTNSTGGDMEVLLHTTVSGLGSLVILVGGFTIASVSGAATNITTTFTVPNGFTYQVNAASTTIHKWSELA